MTITHTETTRTKNKHEINPEDHSGPPLVAFPCYISQWWHPGMTSLRPANQVYPGGTGGKSGVLRDLWMQLWNVWCWCVLTSRLIKTYMTRPMGPCSVPRMRNTPQRKKEDIWNQNWDSVDKLLWKDHLYLKKNLKRIIYNLSTERRATCGLIPRNNMSWGGINQFPRSITWNDWTNDGHWTSLNKWG